MRDRSLFLPLLLLAAGLPALADFQAGVDAFNKGDYTAAAKEWRPLAEAGEPEAQFNLGLLYLDGHGVPQSTAEAVNWFRRAAEQDYTQAQHNLGAMYGSGQGVKRDYIQAYKWLNLCAAKGNSGCVTQRDLIAKKLKPGQIAEAQRLATQFQPQQETAKQ
ncbi:MAG TPA: tetratricopeptide repeat protein [Bryobacteraceae bacterium]|jgi:TPR repeat protein|nr:tetratricopeptide repeat protein [Bryobacteraceae bacterium]